MILKLLLNTQMIWMILKKILMHKIQKKTPGNIDRTWDMVADMLSNKKFNQY